MKKTALGGLLLLALSSAVSAQVRPRPLPRRDRGDRPVPRMTPRPGQQSRGEANQSRRHRLQQEIIRRINLTDEQRIRLRDIIRGQEQDLLAAGRRVRLARNALDRAMMSAGFDEAEVNRLADEFASAQADLIRLQARRRAAVRSVLTPEQMIQFNEMERELRRRQQQRREQQLREGAPPRELQLREGAPPRDQPDGY